MLELISISFIVSLRVGRSWSCIRACHEGTARIIVKLAKLIRADTPHSSGNNWIRGNCNRIADEMAQEVRIELSRKDWDAALFDMDGVLTDTLRLHIAAWKELLDEFLRRLRRVVSICRKARKAIQPMRSAQPPAAKAGR